MLAGGSLPGALLTIGVLSFARIDHLALSRIVTQSLGVALILTALAILGKHWMLVGSLPGIWLGSTLSARVPDRLLRSGLASVLVIIGGKLVL